MADIGKRKPNAIETQFELASMAKQFTGMCIALLEEQDKISVSDDITKYFPEFNFGEPVRIKNLLDHSSGIREGYVLALLAGKVNLKGEIPRKKNTEKFLLEMLSRERDLNFHPGDEMVYTNVNYILLAEIVERVSGQTFSAFADSAIFRPLGMTQTFVRDKPVMYGENESRSYLAKKNRFKKTSKLGGIVGDHNLVTTLDDMIRWTNNFNNNKLGKRDPGLIRKISASSFLNSGDSTRYGYGLNVWRDRGVLKVGHGGDDGGHTCIVTRYPEHDLAVICLANSSRYNDTETKGGKVGEIMLEKFFRKPKLENNDPFIKLPFAELQQKVGHYWRIHEKGLGQFRKVHLKDSSLYIAGYLKNDGLKISPVSHTYFKFTHPQWGTSHVHFRDSSGVILLQHGWRDQPLEEFKPISKSLKINYRDFKGAYWNKSTGATIKVKSKKGKIVARKGIIRIPLIPFNNDLFFGYEHDALFIFSRNEKGEVDRLKINARDFRNFKMQKIH